METGVINGKESSPSSHEKGTKREWLQTDG
jgi:hypothetical protein